MARKILCVDDLGEGFCYDSTTEKINTVGGTSTPVAVEDANGNVTVLNGNGNIPTDCTLRVSGGVLGLSNISSTGSYVAPSPLYVNGAVADGTIYNQTIDAVVLNNPSTCRSRTYMFLFNGRIGARSNAAGANVAIAFQCSIDSGSNWNSLMAWNDNSPPNGPDFDNTYTDQLFITVPPLGTVKVSTRWRVGVDSGQIQEFLASGALRWLSVIQ